ncbi:MAG: DUF2335 domain-containing protein [Gammaproteobacteria bacterium]|nr:DUF2335 domain-containing protein [Gammaproteobacteria bacterium]
MRGRQGKAPVKKRQSTVQRQNKQQVIQVTEQFSGPIPPPDTLEKYNQITPGAAERIIAMAERETGHRHDTEQLIISNEYKEAKRGHIFALIICSLGILTGGYIAISGLQWAAMVIGSSVVIGLASTFIIGRNRK